MEERTTDATVLITGFALLWLIAGRDLNEIVALIILCVSIRDVSDNNGAGPSLHLQV